MIFLYDFRLPLHVILLLLSVPHIHPQDLIRRLFVRISGVSDQLRVGPREDPQERLLHHPDEGGREPDEQEKEDPADWAKWGGDSSITRTQTTQLVMRMIILLSCGRFIFLWKRIFD